MTHMADNITLRLTFHSVVMVGLGPTIHDFFGGRGEW